MAKKLKLTPEKAAANGAIFLDKFQPGWWKKIDTSELELVDGSRCIIGQLNHGSYDAQSYCADLIENKIGDPLNDDTTKETDITNTVLGERFRIPGFTIKEQEEVVITRSRDIDIDAAALGFEQGDGPQPAHFYSRLTEAWLSEIEDRRRAAAPVPDRQRKAAR